MVPSMKSLESGPTASPASALEAQKAVGRNHRRSNLSA